MTSACADERYCLAVAIELRAGFDQHRSDVDDASASRSKASDQRLLVQLVPRRRAFRRARAARAADVAQRPAAVDQRPRAAAARTPTRPCSPALPAASTTSRSVGIALDDARGSRRRERIELLDAADRDAARRRRAARWRTDRRRPCRCTAPGAARSPARWRASASSITGWNGPRPARAACDATSGWRSRLFGVSTTSGSGSVSSSSACRRSRWKYCAAVVQFTRRRLMSAAAWRKRSGRALECSGPLAFVAVRQQQHERRRQAPLGAARRRRTGRGSPARR